MKFEVLSRQNAKKMSFKQDIDDCIIISITDIDKDINRFATNSHIKDVCRVQFDDVEIDEIGHIEKSDAEKIISFVNKYVNEVDKIIVHCEAGVSRSAGVCAALMQIINGDDMEIFNNPKFCPNMTCYRAIMTCFFGTYDQDAADEKIKCNIMAWREANDLN
jgi:predicted protein tyrosine phosphatase